VPGLIDGALVLLPEGILIGGGGAGGAYDREPLVRSAARVLGARATPALFTSGRGAFVECAGSLREHFAAREPRARRGPALYVGYCGERRSALGLVARRAVVCVCCEDREALATITSRHVASFSYQ
jgi:hypothetical protein